MLYEQSSYKVDGDRLRIGAPVFKVDVERRMIHGFATLDNLDNQADIVTVEASQKAFSKFRGNLREQHDSKKAVGKVVSFRDESVYDPDTENVYKGVFVSAYISKGAQDTWEKILDGTLSGFSIGGAINLTEDYYDEKVGSIVRMIKDYDLVELSVVDSPANPLANVTMVEKVDGETQLTDSFAGAQDVMYCKSDGVVSLENNTCPICDCEMQSIGFVESKDINKVDAIKKLIDGTKEKEVNKMAESSETAAESVSAEEELAKSDVVEDSADSEVPESEQSEAVEMEKSEDVETSEDATEEVVKSDDVVEVAKSVDATLDVVNVMVDTIKALNTKIDAITKELSAVTEQITETNKSVDTVKSELTEFEKRVDDVEDTTAFRKSGDLGEVAQEEEVEKTSSIWGGKFLTVSGL